LLSTARREHEPNRRTDPEPEPTLAVTISIR
jgi:hypothetical protein